jgi:hypothetical protein
MSAYIFYTFVAVASLYAVWYLWCLLRGANHDKMDPTATDRRECSWEEGCDDL